MPSAPKPPPVIVGAFGDGAIAQRPSLAERCGPQVSSHPLQNARDQDRRNQRWSVRRPRRRCRPRAPIEINSRGRSRIQRRRATPKQPTSPGAVTDAGFGAAAGNRAKTSEARRGASARAGSRPTGAAKAAPEAPPAPRIDTPVEILFKPTPAYRMRRALAEGEVLEGSVQRVGSGARSARRRPQPWPGQSAARGGANKIQTGPRQRPANRFSHHRPHRFSSDLSDGFWRETARREPLSGWP